MNLNKKLGTAFCLIALSLCCILPVKASTDRIPAFPGADGAGKYTTGGRGDRICRKRHHRIARTALYQ